MGMSGVDSEAGNLTVAIFALVLEDALGRWFLYQSDCYCLFYFAVLTTVLYRRHADWKYIFRLLPYFLLGTIWGWWVFDYFQGGVERVSQLKIIIGILQNDLTPFPAQAIKRKQIQILIP